MTHTHECHPKIAARLKRANGHLAKVIAMIEQEKPCLDIAQQLQAVESAVTNAKRALIHDHIDHCLVPGNDYEGGQEMLADLKSISRYL
ncbi:metal-sensing transcriptional repressor [Leisingera sp. ANG-Vp]|uniref:metal-sensing transcriptional repressor n=1 Tax=Leisingera sp. ANG-Vp TaxID=1577896 RepID=UPI00057F432C|nr:metal-sensing transcriptional repressor [Leisingera sp. ANG-Vp]KIC14942.1 hypothetical protein RA20_19565 [Leisingera sp. ANG-Vp]